MRWLYADGHGNTATVRRADEFFELRVYDHGSLVWSGTYRSKHDAASALRGMYRDMRQAGREPGFHGALRELLADGACPLEAMREMGIDEDG